MRKIPTIIDGNSKGFCDEDAFVELYKKYCGRVAFICHKFCDNKEDVEEVVQDTFMIAFKKSAELRADTLMAYLRKIAIRESIRKRNASGRRQELVITSEELPVNSQELDQSFLPEEALQNKERKSELMRLIDSLPKMQREMIYMYYFADFSVAEIAELMNCTANNVSQALHTAKKTLKAKLEGKDKKAKVKLAVLVPLGELFLIEEQAFAAAYTPMANPYIATAITATATKPIKGYVIATGIVTAGIIATVLYFNLRPTYEDYPAYQPYEPVYEAYTPYETEADTTEEPIEEIEPIPPPTVEEEPKEEHEEPEPEHPPPTQPQVEPPPTVQEEPPAQLPPEETYEPVPEETPEPPETTPPEPEEVVELPPPPPEIIEPEPEEEPDPVHIDRTAQILAALAAANNAADVTGIINYFGFDFYRQIGGAIDERLRFYVTDEGSGDILIGMAALEDGTGWRMKFEHYNNGQAPSNASDLLRWLENR